MSFETETYVQLEQIIRTITPPKKIKSSDYLESGKYPIIDQSPGEIAGWTNEESALVHPPTEGLIVFGDHTCVLKYMAEPFAQGADGIKILRPDESVNAYYIFAHLKAFPLPNDGYKRHFSDLKRLEIKVPEKRIQDYISELAFLFNSKINVNMALSKTLESIAQSIFKSWFIDFDPVHAKSRGEKPFGMDDETAALFPDTFEESELGMIPKGWSTSDLGEVLSVLESGKRPKGGAQSEGIPSIGAESIRNLGQFDFASTKYVSLQFFQSMNSGKVKPYDVLVYKDGAGAGAHVTMFGEGFPYEAFAINEHVFLLRSDQVPQSYLFFWLNNENYKFLMVELAQKSAQPGLNQKDMKSIPILKPESSVLSTFSKLLSPIVEMIMKNSLQNISLEQVREGLLPRLISGELQIPEELLVS